MKLNEIVDRTALASGILLALINLTSFWQQLPAESLQQKIQAGKSYAIYLTGDALLVYGGLNLRRTRQNEMKEVSFNEFHGVY